LKKEENQEKKTESPGIPSKRFGEKEVLSFHRKEGGEAPQNILCFGIN
jgi:hypothetical protein